MKISQRSRAADQPIAPSPARAVQSIALEPDAEQWPCRLLLGRSVSIAYARTPSGDMTRNACHHALLVYLFAPNACPVCWRLARGRQHRGRLAAGRACLFPPGTIEAIEWESVAESLMLYLEPALFRAHLSAAYAEPTGQGCLLPSDRQVRQLARKLRSTCIDSNPRSEQAEQVALNMTTRVASLLRLSDPTESLMQTQRQPRLLEATVRRIDDYIRSHLAEEIRLTELSRIAEIPANQLTECIRRATGLRPSQYIARRRLERAKDMLSRHPYKIRDVAREVGYPDPTNFSERFKTMFGCRPCTFRALAAKCRHSSGETG